jgi:hypothetical protein
MNINFTLQQIKQYVFASFAITPIICFHSLTASGAHRLPFILTPALSRTFQVGLSPSLFHDSLNTIYRNLQHRCKNHFSIGIPNELIS